MECKALRDSDQEIRHYDVAYFMASTDTLEDNTKFAEMNEATFPILADPDKTVSEAYGVLAPLGYAQRWTFYIDPDGVIQKIDKQVNAAQAGEQLVANLEALGVPVAAQQEGVQ
jgi:peroxiredoxin Q/BCP